MTFTIRELFAHLETRLQSLIPGSRLEKTRLPQAPEMSLCLINGDYPRKGLTPEQAQVLMENPPYWSFCWTSGQVLGRCVLDHPDWVKGRTVLDFGAGSGVVGIAAKMAGAGRVILCDLDETALQAGALNARLNGVSVESCSAIENLREDDVSTWVITAADVLYDTGNLPLLETLLDRSANVFVSDSRLKGRPLQGLDVVADYVSRTVPDLDESPEFSRVTLYRSRQSR